MTLLRRLGQALWLPWSPGRRWAAEVLEGRGTGLSRLLLAALCLTLALAFLANRELNRYLDEAPAILAQLPRLGLRGGALWTDPPTPEPLWINDRAGRPILLLDLDATLRLADQPVDLQLTRTRLLVKGAENQIQAFPLASPGQPDGELKPAELLAFLQGPARWLALTLSVPLLFVLALGLLFVQQALLTLMILVPNRLYGTRLEWIARLRLISLAILASSQLSALALVLGLPLGLPWLVPVLLSLAGLMKGVLAVQAVQARPAQPPAAGADPGA